MYILTNIHISKYLVVHNVFSFNYSIHVVIFFLNPGTSELFMKISTKLFFIGLRTLKPTRTRTLNRIPIWHGLI